MKGEIFLMTTKQNDTHILLVAVSVKDSLTSLAVDHKGLTTFPNTRDLCSF